MQRPAMSAQPNTPNPTVQVAEDTAGEASASEPLTPTSGSRQTPPVEFAESQDVDRENEGEAEGESDIDRSDGSTGELEVLYASVAKALRDGYSLPSVLQTVTDAARDHRLGGPSPANLMIERLVNKQLPYAWGGPYVAPPELAERSRSRSRQTARQSLVLFSS